MAKKEYDDELDAAFIIDQVRGRNRRLRAAAEPEPEEVSKQEVPPAADTSVPARREGRRRRGQDYESLFFTDAPQTTRSGKTVYIRAEFHERLMRIVQVIGRNEISLYSYLDNVLAHHFESYQEEISTLYKERNRDIF